MAIFDNVVGNTTNKGNFKGYVGNPPTTEAEYIALDCWTDTALAPTWGEVSVSMDLEEVRVSRKQEYDKLNQWEMQFDDNRDGTTTWVDSINEIKERFPK